MKAIKITKYACELCKEKYDTEQEALDCEKKPITYDKGIKLGDTVIITGGEGRGKRAKVTFVSVASKYWGHYAWERYWHTVCLTADLVDGSGSRFLTFDQYERG